MTNQLYWNLRKSMYYLQKNVLMFYLKIKPKILKKLHQNFRKLRYCLQKHLQPKIGIVMKVYLKKSHYRSLKHENNKSKVSEVQPTIVKSAEINVLSSEKCPDILSVYKAKIWKEFHWNLRKSRYCLQKHLQPKTSDCVEGLFEEDSLPKSKTWK